MMWWYGESPGWGWLLMSLGMVAFWTLMAVVVFALFRGTRDGRRTPPVDDGTDARRVLDERFARGEIDESDYRVRRELLGSGR